MSQAYRQLVSCEKKLRTALITKTVISKPTTETSQYRLRSYRILCHAEIEYCIENIVLDKIVIEKSKWLTLGVIPKCIANLLAYSSMLKLPQLPSRLGEISTANDVSYRVGRVISTFETNVKRNNGIKEINIIPLLIPIGIDYTKLNQTLLNNLSSFGISRGATAHNSSKVQHLINPSDEIRMVQQIIQELQIVDDLIDGIN
ncbi:MAG: hypothetical protein CVU39_06240 [Chloroflexi bacterium HGW-Chloroflexi-10]|nr:MAG: hypothetical protein CVU39_06240 [Chloroflexi bacterium HGW-Chloroflexi-10]